MLFFEWGWGNGYGIWVNCIREDELLGILLKVKLCIYVM